MLSNYKILCRASILIGQSDSSSYCIFYYEGTLPSHVRRIYIRFCACTRSQLICFDVVFTRRSERFRRYTLCFMKIILNWLPAFKLRICNILIYFCSRFSLLFLLFISLYRAKQKLWMQSVHMYLTQYLIHLCISVMPETNTTGQAQSLYSNFPRHLFCRPS